MLDPAVQLVALQQDLDKLDKAIGSGVLTVDSHIHGRITYRDMPSMMAARAFLLNKIAGLTNTGVTRRIVVTGRSGF